MIPVTSRSALPVLALASALLLAACSPTEGPADAPADGTQGPTPDAVVSAPVETSDAPAVEGSGEEFDLAAFCEAAAPMLVPVEREFIGSDEHVAQFTALGEVAPEELEDVIDSLEAHYGTAVSPSDPDSQDFKNFPASIQDDALALDAEVRERC